ncbi:MAG: glycerol-3-phosphate dehydrogenase/oxidase [Spirochaetales bacterium]|nr:glycerol-3-phosphate dehydrogenase/oxidase [Leptospiraceae bacterium]MCP5482447.1 glycerol-3-phosphate dehydrogenase/oxidase [Spirochaetales bacterium]MCP5485849.1 glycerol-3-phosphate dehydrogenase/oxidase [Spirochaetales bacterium]
MKLRESNIEKMQSRTFDVLIVGGGINGAVCASSLTSRGASVALIDRGDFSSFTSQESSNLVWGGIKYLETLEFGLVRKLCVARNHLIKSYPSNVKEIRFFVTLQKGFRHNRLFLFCGALLYWFIGAFFTRAPRLLSRKAIQAEEPVVDISSSPGGFEYSDAFLIDNDARFVFKFIRAAMDHGGIVGNYLESAGSRREGDLWVTEVRDLIGNRSFQIRSKVLINACGPYVDQHNQLSGEQTEHHHLFSKGIHLLVDRVTPQRRVLTFFADDGRLFFVIPMGNKSCIGTTDTRVEELPARVTEEDRQFVLRNINKLLKLDPPLNEGHIIAERCGVRPLVVEARPKKRDTGDWTALSRKHAIEANREHRIVSIFGGKLTDCLNVGNEVAAEVRALGIEMPFYNIRWYGEPPRQVKEEFYHQARLMNLDAMTAPTSSEALSRRFWRRYGAAAFNLLEDIRNDPAMGELLIEGTEYIRCELYHAARREMVTRLEDFLRRRSKIALQVRTETIRGAPGLAEACEILFGEDGPAQIRRYFDEH